MSKKPKIRFKGFTDDWEQRKLGNLVTIERGGSPRPIDAYITEASDGLNWVKIGDAPEQGRYITHTKEKIKLSGLSKTRQVFPGDLILSNSMSFGKPYIMGIYGCIHDGWLLIRNNQNAFDLKFLCHMLGTEQMLIQYRRLAAGSTVNNLNKELVSNARINVPNKVEQEKIGVFLELVDNAITLHQRKYEKLLKIKKSMLENMFPKNGEMKPKIRFKGFTDDWEQCKLADIVGATYGGGTPATTNEAFWNGNIPWIQSSNTIEGQLFDMDVKKHISRDGLTHSATQMIPGNSIAVVTHVGVGKLVFMPYSYTTSQDFISLSYLKCDPQFLCYALYRKLQEDLHIVQGSAIKGITKEDLMIKQLVIPKIGEQEQIANTLESLDHLITLHQRKLEKLKKLKKSMLENMFA